MLKLPFASLPRYRRPSTSTSTPLFGMPLIDTCPWPPPACTCTPAPACSTSRSLAVRAPVSAISLRVDHDRRVGDVEQQLLAPVRGRDRRLARKTECAEQELDRARLARLDHEVLHLAVRQARDRDQQIERSWGDGKHGRPAIVGKATHRRTAITGRGNDDRAGKDAVARLNGHRQAGLLGGLCRCEAR